MSVLSTIQPTDIAILLVALVTCGYCFVLSRRLQALRDTRDGLGATIMALSKSIATMSETTQDTRQKAAHIATKLATVMKEAEETSARIDAVTRASEAAHADTLAKVKAAQAELSSVLGNMLKETRQRVDELAAIADDARNLRRDSYRPDDPHELFQKDSAA